LFIFTQGNARKIFASFHVLKACRKNKSVNS